MLMQHIMVGEFEFIEKLKKRSAFSRIGDDCAVLPKDDAEDLVVTADLLVEGIDFRQRWASANDVGHKALAVSLSDIAAMGGRPLWALVSIAIPKSLWVADYAEAFYEGYVALAQRFGVEVAGGDISRSDGGFVVDSVVAGAVPRRSAILRSGARAGDRIWVSGDLGGAAAALEAFESGAKDHPAASRLLRPNPRVELGRSLLESGVVTSMIDISDGLSGDLMHICRASGVGAEIESGAIPIDPRIEDSDHAFRYALNGGEDFELLLTSTATHDLSEISRNLKPIGTVTASLEVIELVSNNTRTRIVPRSFRHF